MIFLFHICTSKTGRKKKFEGKTLSKAVDLISVSVTQQDYGQNFMKNSPSAKVPGSDMEIWGIRYFLRKL